MEIIKIKPEWEVILRKHEHKLDDIQHVVNKLIDSGLKITKPDIVDLINHGLAVYEQAEQAVKSNAGIFRLPKAKAKFIEENTSELNKVIAESKIELNNILALGTTNGLSLDAYDISKGTVSINTEWIEKLKESHTIRSNENREKALQLMQNVKESIEELNDFVKDNKYFGTGVTTFQDDRRSLVWLNGLGDINFDLDNLELIK